MQATELKRAAAYVRVSTYHEEQEKSLADQIAMLNKVIDDDETLVNVGNYVDQGVTGKYQAKRKQFLKLIKDCLEGRVDVVYVKQMRRFGRNALESLQAIEKLRERGIPVRFVMDEIDTIADRDCTRLAMLANMAEEERDSLQETMIWSFQRRMEQGDYVFRPDLLFGYTLNKQKEMVIVKHEAEAVRYMFERYAAGDKFKDIANWLTAHGYLTRKGTPFCKSSIYDILTNEKYYGDLKIGKTVEVKGKRKKNDGEAPMYVYHNHHEGIISKELFDKCMALRASRRYDRRVPDEGDVFQKKVYCGQCGGLFIRQTRTNCVSDFSQVAYTCGKAVRSGRRDCRNKMQRIGTLEDSFVAVYNYLSEHKSEISDIATDNTEFNEINARLAELRESEKMYFEAEVRGIMNEQMKKNHTKLVGEMLELEERRRFLLSRNFEVSANNANLKKCLQKLKELPHLESFDSSLFEVFVAKILIMNRNSLIFVLTSGHKLQVEIDDYYKTRDEIRRVYVSE